MKPLNAAQMKELHAVAAARLAPVIKGRVSSVVISMDGYTGLIIDKPRKAKQPREWTILWFMRDPEGNGPGWFDLHETNNATDVGR